VTFFTQGVNFVQSFSFESCFLLPICSGNILEVAQGKTSCL